MKMDEAQQKAHYLNELLEMRSKADEFATKIEDLRAKKSDKPLIGVVGLSQSGKSYFLNVLAKFVDESDFIFGRSGELEKLEYYSGEKFAFLDTPPLESDFDFEKNFIKKIDLCILVHDVNRDLDDYELDILYSYRNRAYWQYYPIIIVLTHLDKIKSSTELEKQCRSLSKMVRIGLGIEDLLGLDEGLGLDEDKDVDLGFEHSNPVVIPFYGPGFLSWLKDIGYNRYCKFFGYQLEDKELIKAQGRTVYEGSSAHTDDEFKKHSAMSFFLSELYNSSVYEHLQRMHSAIKLAKRSDGLKYFFTDKVFKELVAESTNLMHEGIREIDSYKDDFRQKYNLVIYPPKKCRSIIEAIREKLKFLEDLRSYAKNNILYTFDEERDQYLFKLILIERSSDVEGTILESLLYPLILPKAGKFLLENGPHLSYDKTVVFFEYMHEIAMTKQVNMSKDKSLVMLLDACASTFIIHQVILGADLTIKQNVFNFLQEINKFSNYIKSIELDAGNVFEEYSQELHDLIYDIEDDILQEVSDVKKAFRPN